MLFDFLKTLRAPADEKATADVPRIIFDTDMIEDFDDVGALACLHALADAGECEILATISSTRGNASVAAIEVINGYYGRGGLPVGCTRELGVLGDKGVRNGRTFTGHSPWRRTARSTPRGARSWMARTFEAGAGEGRDLL